MQTYLSPSDTLMYIAEYHKVIGDVTSRFWSECCRDSNEEEHGDTQAWNDPVFDVWLVRIKNIQYQISHHNKHIFSKCISKQLESIGCMYNNIKE